MSMHTSATALGRRTGALLVGLVACLLSMQLVVPPGARAAGPVTAGASARAVSTTAVTSVVVPRPTGVLDGDVLVAHITADGAPSIGAAPAGWSTVISPLAVGSSARVFAYYRVVAQVAAEPSSYTWRLSTAVKWNAGITVFHGVDGTNPFDTVARTRVNTSSSRSVVVSGVTTSTPGAMLVGGVGPNSSSVTVTAPTNWSESIESTGGQTAELAFQARPAVGATGTATWRLSASATAAGWLRALRPAPASGPGPDNPPPSAPGPAAATADGPGQVTVRWTASTDDVGVASYRLVRNSTVLAAALSSGTTVYLDTTVAPSTQYTYAISAVDGAGNRSGEATAVVTTPAPNTPSASASNPLVGGVTATTATVTYKTTGVTSARLVVATDASLTADVVESPGGTPDSSGYVRLSVSGLREATRYHYGLRVDGGTVPTGPTGRFSTFPATAPASFTFAFASCLDDVVAGDVFDDVAAADPAFFMPIGDFGYLDSASSAPQTFRDFYELMLGKPAVGAALRTRPVTYTWDDHDYGLNNADSTSPSRAAVATAYRDRWPSYALPATDGTGIWQTFTYGPDVRFVVLDVRSQRTPGSMLGAQQKQWAIDTVAQASEPVIFVVSPAPWISTTPGDGWADWATEQADLVDAWTRAGKIDRMVVLAGDMHAIAADDGRNSPGRLPVFQAAALGRGGGSIKGGPYSSGPPIIGSATNGQFGLVTVNRTDAGYDVQFRGRNQAGTDVLSLTVPVPRPSPPPDRGPPSVPGGVVARADDPRQVTVTWTASTDDVGVASYRVSRDGSVVADVVTAGTSFVDTTVAPDTRYSYTVSAVDAAGKRSAESTPALATTPPMTAPPPPGGAVTVVASTSTGNTAAAAAVTLTKPAGVVAGDVLIAQIHSDGVPTLAAPPGWAPVVDPISLNTNARLFTFYRVAGGSEPVSYQWTMTPAIKWNGGMTAFRGVDNANPFDGAGMTGSNPTTTATTLTLGGVTTTVPGAMVVGGIGLNGTSTTVTQPSAWTERFEKNNAQVTELATQDRPTVGPTGDASWTFSAASISVGWMRALRPA